MSSQKRICFVCFFAFLKRSFQYETPCINNVFVSGYDLALNPYQSCHLSTLHTTTKGGIFYLHQPNSVNTIGEYNASVQIIAAAGKQTATT